MRNLLFITLILSTSILTAQDFATDFTADDCSGESHHLFGELDAGQVVVIAWVMPCFACIEDPRAAYNLVADYAETNQGAVRFYVADDYANTSCSTLQGWCDNNGMSNVPVFSDASIDMGDYGQNGMPKIAVMGCAAHKVYFNSNYGIDGLVEAIDLAIADCATGVEESLNISPFAIFPNPVSDSFTLSYDNRIGTNLEMTLVDLRGREIFRHDLDSQKIGPNEITFTNLNFKQGSYILQITDGNGKQYS